MVQWDLSFYSCVLDADKSNERHYCLADNAAITGPLLCPGLPSDFWISIHQQSGGGYQVIEEILARDETNRTYIFGKTGGKFCWEAGPWQDLFGTGTECDVYAGYYIPTAFSGSIIIANPFSHQHDIPDQVPFFFPGCLYDYPNDMGVNNETVLCLKG